MNIIEHDVTAVYIELLVFHERAHKLILVREIAASHRMDKIHHLRLLEKLAAWRKNDGFDRSEVLAEKQRRIQEHVCSVDGPKHSEVEMQFEPRRSPSPQELAKSMWAEVNRLKQLPPQPPQYDLSPRRSSA